MLKGEAVGFVMCCTYHSEDEKCFVMEMCIYAPYRGRGLGKACFHLLQEQEKAAYYELRTSSSMRRGFGSRWVFSPTAWAKTAA